MGIRWHIYRRFLRSMQLGGLGSVQDWRSHQGIRQSKLYWSLNKLNWNRQHCFLCVSIVSNWDCVGFAISQIGIRQIQKGPPWLTSTKKKKCLRDSCELSVVNPIWYLNYITPVEHNKKFKNSTLMKLV